MASSSAEWTELAEHNERLVAPSDARPGGSVPASAGAPRRTPARTRATWRLRGRRAAAAAVTA